MQPAFHQQNYKECIWSNRRLKIPITIVGTEIGICVSCLLPPPHTLLILHSQMTPPTSSQLSSLSVSSLLFRFQLILLFLFLSLSFLTEPRVPGHLCRKTVNSEGLGMESPQGRTCKQRERKNINHDHNYHLSCLPCVGHCEKLITMSSHCIHTPSCLTGIISSMLKMPRLKNKRDLSNYLKGVSDWISLISFWQNKQTNK